ncbi:MAG: hypothetical protein AB1728_11820 [Bacteroidota bacterium]
MLLPIGLPQKKTHSVKQQVKSEFHIVVNPLYMKSKMQELIPLCGMEKVMQDFLLQAEYIFTILQPEVLAR